MKHLASINFCICFPLLLMLFTNNIRYLPKPPKKHVNEIRRSQIQRSLKGDYEYTSNWEKDSILGYIYSCSLIQTRLRWANKYTQLRFNWVQYLMSNGNRTSALPCLTGNHFQGSSNFQYSANITDITNIMSALHYNLMRCGDLIGREASGQIIRYIIIPVYCKRVMSFCSHISMKPTGNCCQA